MVRMSSIRAPVFRLCMLCQAMSALPSAGRALFVTTFLEVMLSALLILLCVVTVCMCWVVCILCLFLVCDSAVILLIVKYVDFLRCLLFHQSFI